MSKKIFVYKNTVAITDDVLNELKNAGYICVPVKYLDDVKVIDYFPEVEGDWLMRTLIDLFKSAHASSGLREAFGKQVLDYIEKQHLGGEKDEPDTD